MCVLKETFIVRILTTYASKALKFPKV